MAVTASAPNAVSVSMPVVGGIGKQTHEFLAQGSPWRMDPDQGHHDDHRDDRAHHHYDRAPGGDGGHRHTHGAVDPSIATTSRGIWALKWSFAGMMVTALLQAVIVWLSGSVALLADTIHNFGDASTAIPLWIAFAFA